MGSGTQDVMDAGREDAGTRGRGRRKRWDSGTCEDSGMWEVRTRGRNKQTTPDFCTELIL